MHVYPDSRSEPSFNTRDAHLRGGDFRVTSAPVFGLPDPISQRGADFRIDDYILVVSCCPCADRWRFVIRSGKNLEHLSRTHGAQKGGNTQVGFARSYFAVSVRFRCASRPTRNCERHNTDIGFIAVCQTVGNSGNNFLI